jgi:hypothetical protein
MTPDGIHRTAGKDGAIYVLQVSVALIVDRLFASVPPGSAGRLG